MSACCRLAAVCSMLVVMVESRGAVLMEEGFPYAAGTALGVDVPWAGNASSALSIVSGNLTVSNLQVSTPPGNTLQIGPASGGTVYRNFTGTAIAPAAGTAVYFAAVINCTFVPTNRQFVAALMQSGVTSPNPPDDPLDLYVSPGTGGYRLTIGHTGADTGTTFTSIPVNTSHLIVMKYLFGFGGAASVYIDPTPGGLEPASPDAQTGSSDDDGGTGGTDPANLQIVLLHSASSTYQGLMRVDTLRIGTNWADVTPLTFPVSVTDPQSQAICAGSPVTFSVTGTGTPPIRYQWRTNGVAIPGATTNTYSIPSPTAADASKLYDVVVNDAHGAITSQVATLTITHAAAGIATSPASQIVMPGTSNITFTVTASGDAPISYQWRTNGVAIGGATNSFYTINNPTPTDALNAFDVVAANPCGAATSSPAMLLFPHGFFTSQALPGFFGGMNLITTNTAGIAMYVWSSPDSNQPITSWFLEGPMQEQPLNDGSGNSRYSINVTPAVSPVFYMIGQTTSAPYLQPVPVQWITTDIYGNYYFFSATLAIRPDGVLVFPGDAPQIAAARISGGLQFGGYGVPGTTYRIQVATNFTPPIAWTTVASNVADSTGLVQFMDTNVTANPRRFYRLVSP